MRSALLKICTSKTLTKCFDEIYRRKSKKQRTALDINNETLENIKERKKDLMLSFSKEIKTKEYHPRNLKPHFIIKTNGKERVICSPSIRDKVLQKSILKFLHENNLSLENRVSFGFIKGEEKGVKGALDQALKLRKNYEWVYKTDITSFFDTIDREIIKEKVKKRVRHRSLHHLIFKLIDCEIHLPDKRTRKRVKKQGIIKGIGLRQGMPISPWLSNLMLESFDNSLIKSELNVVRYADDLIVFCKTREECLKHHKKIKSELATIGLQIPEIAEDSKTQIFHPKETVEFLGIGIEWNDKGFYEKIITSQQKRKIKEKINNYSDMAYCIKNNITLGKLINKLNHSIDGYESAYQHCSNIESLKTSMLDQKTTIISKIFKKLCKNFNLNNLSTEQKKFFEISG